MAFSWSVLESGVGDGDFVTGTISPSYMPVILVVAFAGEPFSPPTNPVVSGCNLTWTLQGTPETYSGRRIICVFEGTGTPTSGTLSISATSGTRGSCYAVLEANNIDSVGTWTYNSGGPGTTSTVTVGGTGDETLSFHVFEGTGLSPSPETGSLLFTEDEVNDVRMLTGYNDAAGDTTPSVSWGSSDGWGAVGALFTEAAGGISQAIGLATETDTPLALSKAKAKAFALATEADTVLAMSAAKALAIGLAAETETVLSLTVVKTRTIGLSTENDTVLALSSLKALAVGLATETDTPLTMTVAGTILQAIGLATETDTPLAPSASKAKAFGLGAEADAVLALTSAKTKAAGLATEADTPLAMTPVKTLALGLATESDTILALAVLKVFALGLLTETDTPLSLTSPEVSVVAAYGTVFRPNRVGTVNRPNRTGTVNRPNRVGTVQSDRQGD